MGVGYCVVLEWEFFFYFWLLGMRVLVIGVFVFVIFRGLGWDIVLDFYSFFGE